MFALDVCLKKNLPESTPEEEKGGTEALTPRYAQFAHGLPHWFQSPKESSDTKREKKEFWVRKKRGPESIQLKQKLFEQRAQRRHKSSEKNQREGTRNDPEMASS